MIDFSYFFNNASMAKILDYILDEVIENIDKEFTRSQITLNSGISQRHVSAHVQKLVEAGLLQPTRTEKKYQFYKLKMSPLTSCMIQFKSQLLDVNSPKEDILA